MLRVARVKAFDSAWHEGLWAVIENLLFTVHGSKIKKKKRSYEVIWDGPKTDKIDKSNCSETQLAVLVNGHLSEWSQMTVGNSVRRQESSTCTFAAPPVFINFHPLPRGNASITRQPQPGCIRFRQIMSRDHVIVIDFRQPKKLSFLPFKKNEIFTHKNTIKDINAASIATHV